MEKKFYPRKLNWFVTIADEDKAYRAIVNLIRDLGESPEPESITVLNSFLSIHGAFRIPAEGVKLIITKSDLKGGYVLYVEPEGLKTTFPVTPESAKALISGEPVDVKEFLSEDSVPFLMPGFHPGIINLAKRYFVAVHLNQKTFTFYKLQEKYPPRTIGFKDFIGRDKDLAIKLNDYVLDFSIRERKGKRHVFVRRSMNEEKQRQNIFNFSIH